MEGYRQLVVCCLRAQDRVINLLACHFWVTAGQGVFLASCVPSEGMSPRQGQLCRDMSTMFCFSIYQSVFADHPGMANKIACKHIDPQVLSH